MHFCSFKVYLKNVIVWKSIWSADNACATEWMNECRFKSPLKLTAPHSSRVLSPESGTRCCRRTASALPSTPPWLLILWSLPSLLYIILKLKEIFINYSLNKSPMLETCKTVRLLWWKVKGPDPALLTTFLFSHVAQSYQQNERKLKTVRNPCKEPKHRSNE